jgi:hypothetical protein
MNKILEFLGLIVPEMKKGNFPYPNYQYSHESATEQRDYLKGLVENQRDRQTAIESKTSQLVGQSSIVFSLVALFIPLFFDQFLERSLWIKGITATLFLITFIFYLFTIFHAARNFSIHRFTYSTGDPDTVLNRAKRNEFLVEEINDLIFITKVNSYANDQKGTNLIFAHRTFSIGNLMFAALALVLCSILFIPTEVSKIDRERQVLLERQMSEIAGIHVALTELRRLDSAEVVMLSKLVENLNLNLSRLIEIEQKRSVQLKSPQGNRSQKQK